MISLPSQTDQDREISLSVPTGVAKRRHTCREVVRPHRDIGAVTGVHGAHAPPAAADGHRSLIANADSFQTSV
jgi:hypothetical protein